LNERINQQQKRENIIWQSYGISDAREQSKILVMRGRQACESLPMFGRWGKKRQRLLFRNPLLVRSKEGAIALTELP